MDLFTLALLAMGLGFVIALGVYIGLLNSRMTAEERIRWTVYIFCGGSVVMWALMVGVTYFSN